jgi:hypothetical protein
MAAEQERLALGRRYGWTSPSERVIRPAWQRETEVTFVRVSAKPAKSRRRRRRRSPAKIAVKAKQRVLLPRPAATPIGAFLGAPAIRGG